MDGNISRERAIDVVNSSTPHPDGLTTALHRLRRRLVRKLDSSLSSPFRTLGITTLRKRSSPSYARGLACFSPPYDTEARGPALATIMAGITTPVATSPLAQSHATPSLSNGTTHSQSGEEGDDLDSDPLTEMEVDDGVQVQDDVHGGEGHGEGDMMEVDEEHEGELEEEQDEEEEKPPIPQPAYL